jgi:hypothetical protein
MFTTEVIAAAAAAAKKHDVEPAALLAVVEVECAGTPVECDGRTPRLLFERHVFYRELAKVSTVSLTLAIAEGLAIPKWSRATQYKDQRKSAGRLAVLASARAIHEDAANRSCSWGVGQTMGFHATEIGFKTATEMVNFMTQGGLAAQIEVMCRNISQMKLWDELQRHDWAGFARHYNGSGYRQNKYDTRMAAANDRWERKLANGVPLAVDAMADYEVRAIQQRLKDLGYAEVGAIDGKWGSRTTGAIAAFQAHEGVPVTGKVDQATKDALAKAGPREVSIERKETTADDLRQQGSETIKAADKGSWWSKILIFLGLGGGAEQVGGIEVAQEAVGKVSTIGSIIQGARDGIAFLAPYWWIGAVALGAYFLWTYRDVIRRRVADHVAGLHAGR